MARDDSPNPNHDSRVRENSEVVIIYPDFMGNGWRIYEISGEHLKKLPIYGEYHGVDDKIDDLLWHLWDVQ